LYAEDVKSPPSIFFATIFDIDDAVSNIVFPTKDGVAKLVDSWAVKQEDKHCQSTNMKTALAINGFIIRIAKPDAKVFNGKDVAAYRNRRGFGD
jgi:hypothetical protein